VAAVLAEQGALPAHPESGAVSPLDAGPKAPADGASGAGGAGGTNHGSCLDGITDYENAGPFKFEAKSSGSVKIWVPAGARGVQGPVIHLANGTGASCSSYQGALERMASHGFLTTCYENAQTGAGDQGVTAFDTALIDVPRPR